MFKGRPVTSAVELVQAADSLRMSGQLLEVRWDSIIRQGLLTQFMHNWTYHEDVEWEMEFTWVSRGEAEPPMTVAQPASMQDFATQMQTLLGQLQDAIDNHVFSLTNGFVNDLNKNTATMELAVKSMGDAASTLSAAVLSPIDAARRSAAATQSLKDSARAIAQTCDNTPPASMAAFGYESEPTPAGTINTPGLGRVYTTDAYKRKVRNSAKTIDRTASEQMSTITANINQTDLLSVFVARGNTDLRDVSSDFYGVPDHWRDLLSYNHLKSSRLAAGQLVMVPKLQRPSR
jgi:hypothetical protein